MSNQIDSFDVIQQLKRNDIIIRPVTKERYVIVEIGNDFFILILAQETRALKMMRFHDLIKEKWELEKPIPLHESSADVFVKD
ncbi:MAG TPA: hypothetical protein VHZ50_14765 [Puia sp.]|jgi:hypothetical protein|nr:hypothetical protein [Puia sp.]